MWERQYKKNWIVTFLTVVMVFGSFGGIFALEEEGEPLPTVSSESAGEGVAVEEQDASGLTITAKGAILIDRKTGTVLYEKNAHDPLPMASVTKVMSMLLVMEAVEQGKISLEDMVTISDRAAEMGGSQLFMEPGEQHTVAELMKGVAMASANDGCVALAEFVGGSETGFVKMMNDRAAELGLKNTLFQNTNGLPVANHYSSAYDISMISRELMDHEAVRPWLVTWMDTMMVGLPGKQTEFGLANTNKLLKQYPGATGIKTGYTADAKYCLSGSAEKENMELIGVVLGAETSEIRFKEMAAMLDYGFALYSSVNIAEKDTPLLQVKVEKGNKALINAIPEDSIDILMKKDEKQLFSHEVQVENGLKAPVRKGDKVGTLTVLKDDIPFEHFDLVSDSDVEKIGPVAMLIELFHSTFR